MTISHRTKGHPEANGRKPIAGEHAYVFKFPLENGDEVVIEGGEEDLLRFSEMIGSMLIDNDADKAEDQTK